MIMVHAQNVSTSGCDIKGHSGSWRGAAAAAGTLAWPGRHLTARRPHQTTPHYANGVLAHRVIEHAVAGTDVTVKHVSRLFPRSAGQLARPDDLGPGESGRA
jgi:hypothetical protein